LATISVDGHPEMTSSRYAGEASVAGINTRFDPYGPGTYTVHYSYSGEDGIQGSQATVTFTVGPELDQRPPETWFDGPALDPPVANQVTRDLYGLRAASFECAIDDGPWTACTSPWTTPILSDGLHILAARAISAAGIIDSTPDRFAVFVGPILPPGSAYPVDGRRRVLSPIVDLVTSGPGGADLVRLSNSAVVGSDGRLVAGMDVPIEGTNGYLYLSWDLADPAYGGIPGDGHKEIVAQWHLPDGTWTSAVAVSMTLVLTPPSLDVVVDNGAGFVDDSSNLYVLLETTTNDGWFAVQSDPGGLGATIPVPDDGVAALLVPIEPVPLGTAAERTITATINSYELDSGPVTVRVVVDRSSPSATAGAPVVPAGSRVTTSRIRFRLAGTTSDTGSGVASSTLQAQSGTTSYQTVATSTETSVGATIIVPNHGSFRSRVRGADRLGHVGSWAASPTLKAGLYGDGSSLIHYRGWHRAASRGALGGAIHRSTKVGATARIRITGRGFALIAPKGATLGRMSVTIDGHAAGVIRLQRSSRQTRVVVFSRSWIASGTHTIVLQALGSGAVALDGAVVVR
jgi:hypothetical protein